MNRLTRHYKYFDGSDGYSALGFGAIEQRPFFPMIRILAEYEDTGREPEEIPQWIPCSKELPKSNGWCLASGHGRIYVAEFIGIYGEHTPIDSWRKTTGKSAFPTHWQPLPQPPKGEK